MFPVADLLFDDEKEYDLSIIVSDDVEFIISVMEKVSLTGT